MRTGSLRARRTAGSSASSPSTTRTTARCVPRWTSRGDAPRLRWCCRTAGRAAPTMRAPTDLHHGFLGAAPTVNGATDPHLDVATRAYRFRILNASNARTYRLGFNDAAGRPVAFTLLGTDGGLLAAPARCTECFVSPAERIDVLLDLSGAAVGDAIMLRTLAFDPMHFEPPSSGDPAPPRAAAAGEPWPEGAPRRLLTLRVSERVAYRATVPARLSAEGGIDTSDARERAFRLGFAKGRWRINDRVFAMGETAFDVVPRPRRGLVAAQLPHEHAARDARPRRPVPRARAGNLARPVAPARRRRPRPARHRPRLEGHGAGLAWRERPHRTAIRLALPARRRRTCSTATTWSTRTAG